MKKPRDSATKRTQPTDRQMKRHVIVAPLIAGAALLTAAVPLLGHHSFAPEYDAARPMELKGTVTRVEWTNPHVRFYIDVRDASGKVENWNLEMASPNVLSRNGWRKDTLKIGSAEIAGELKADVHAEGTVLLKATAKMFGDIEAKGFVVEEGAVIVGNAKIRAGR